MSNRASYKTTAQRVSDLVAHLLNGVEAVETLVFHEFRKGLKLSLSDEHMERMENAFARVKDAVSLDLHMELQGIIDDVHKSRGKGRAKR